MHWKKHLSSTIKDLSSIPSGSTSTFPRDRGETLWTIEFNTTETYYVSEALRWYVDPGVERTHPMKLFCASSEHFFVPLLSVSVSESPSPLSLLWLGFQLWMLPLTTSVILQRPTYPCLPPFMCDLMYCLTVFPPFKINCSFISPQDKKKSLART